MQIHGTCRQCGLATVVSSNSYLCTACANKNAVDNMNGIHTKAGLEYDRMMAGREKAKRRKKPDAD